MFNQNTNDKKIILMLLMLAGIVLVVLACTEPYRTYMLNYGVYPFDSDEKITIAVLPFRNASGVGGAGIKVAESFQLQLLNTQRFYVLERTKLDEVLREQKFTSRGEIFDPAEASKVGKLAGADLVVLGTVSRYNEKWPGEAPPIVGLNIRIVEVETGSVVWAASDVFRGNDRSIQHLVPSSERWKLKTDLDFLTTVLCREMARTLSI